MRCSWPKVKRCAPTTTKSGRTASRRRETLRTAHLEGAQAGLSWLTILKRRPGYVKAFKKFNPRAVAAFSADDVERLLGDVDIIRHRGKIESTINNAGAVLALQNKVRVSMNSCGPSSTTNRCNEIGRTNQTFRLDARGHAHEQRVEKARLSLVGPTTCYSLMQAAGLVNDHSPKCFRYAEIRQLG